jgi:hypothetical protein
MAYTEILSNHGITQTQWDTDVYFEYIRKSFWLTFAGKNPANVIQTKTQLQKDAGDTIVFELVAELEGGIVTGNTKGIGNEGRYQIFKDSVTVDNIRVLSKLEDIPMSEQRSGLNLLNLSRSRITRKAKLRVDDEITTQLSDDSSGRTRARYLYGTADSNWNATHATALQAVDNTADQLTLKSMSMCKRKALNIGQTVAAQAKVTPIMTKRSEKELEEWFIYVANPLAIRDLVENDATFTNRQLNIPPTSNKNNILFTGSDFLGAHNGILIYEYEGMNLVSSTIQVSHNMLLGAQALVYGIAQTGKFGEEFTDIKHDVSHELHEIRGVKKAVFNRSTEEDHGVVHHFTAAVSD